MSVRGAVAALLLALVVAMAASAQDAPLPNPEEEARARALMREIGCPVCAGQPIDASDAEVARRMRVVVREGVAAGLSDDAVRAQVAQRYGRGALLRPPAQGAGVLLWAAPLLILVLAAGGAVALLARKGEAGEEDGSPEGPPA